MISFLGGTDRGRQRSYWDSDLGHRSADHPVVRAFSRQRWRHVERLLPVGEIRTALDVGCGNGFASRHAPASWWSAACDASERMLRGHEGPRRVRSSAEALPFLDGSFDLVYCWEVLHHLPDPAPALREMARVSRRWVLVLEPNPLNPAQACFALWDREHRWVLRLSRRRLLSAVGSAGLTVRAYRRVGLLFPNVTPPALASALLRLPFRQPLLGISQFVLAEKTASI